MQHVGPRILPAPSIAPEDRLLHRIGNACGSPASSDNPADDAGIRVGVAAAGERLAERIDIGGADPEMAERVREGDPDEAVLRRVRDACAGIGVVEPTADLLASVVARPGGRDLERADRVAGSADQGCDREDVRDAGVDARGVRMRELRVSDACPRRPTEA